MSDEPATTAPDMRAALRRIALGYRVFGALWLDVLALVAITGGGSNRVVAGVAMAVATGWAAVTVLLAGARPAWARSWWFLWADVAIAAGIIVGTAGSGVSPMAFFGGYPFSAVVLAAYTRGYAGGLAAGVVLTAASIARRELIGVLGMDQAFQDMVFYLAGAGILAWGMTVVLRQDALLTAERARRIRSQERADTAAHLHDSVLQTLALIQRRAGDAGEVLALARRQERELRDWLFGARAGTEDAAGTPGSLVAALRDAAAQVEALHRIRVELVHVGDAPADADLSALAAAAREALTNAAKHADVDSVSLYAEVTAETARVFVRDRGRGFDSTHVDPDRRGIGESIIGRLGRHHGAAAVHSVPGEGTEVEMSVQRQGAR
ncbi:MAG TPA: ATP-binding protein [Egibacteraceae bacterium]|nr:ATP-binding protein [Egibacteraceae bacterium]